MLSPYPASSLSKHSTPARVGNRATARCAAVLLAVASGVAFSANTAPLAAAQVTPTTFTYQGQLTSGGQPFNGTTSLRLQLFDAVTGGNSVAPAQTFSDVQVVNGVFTLRVDFGAVFGPQSRWIEISVAGSPGDPFTVLSPRQPVSAAPFAIATRGMTATADGKVGFGTSNPMRPFEVNGAPSNGTSADAILIRGGTGTVVSGSFPGFETVNAGGSIELVGGTGGASTFSGAAGGEVRLTGGAGGNGGFQTSVGGAVIISGGAGGANSFGGQASPGGPVILRPGPGGGAGGSIWLDGRTGIGTASPQAFLDVVAPAGSTASSSIALTAGSAVGGGLTAAAGGGLTFTAGTGALPNSGIGSSGGDITLVPGRGGAPTGGGAGSPGRSGAVVVRLSPVGNTPTPGAINGEFRIESGPTLGNWHMRIVNGNAPTFNGGIRISDDGFLDVTNRIGGTSFARLNGLGVWTTVSDATVKKDITTVSDQDLLDAVLRLRPVRYHYTSEPGGADGAPKHLGLIAQEVEKVLPELVSRGGDLRTLDYATIGVVAVGAVQRQQRLLRDQQAVIDRHERTIAQQQRAIEAMAARLEAVERAQGAPRVSCGEPAAAGPSNKPNQR